MTANPHRVTTTHLQHLAARTGPVDHGHTALVDTDTGIQIIAPGQILKPGSGVRRLLLAREDLVESAGAAGLTVSAYVRAFGGSLAADLNDVITTDNS